MPYIPDEDQQFLREQFSEHMEQQVTVLLFTKKPSVLFIPGTPDTSQLQQTQELLEEVASLSDKLAIEVYDYVNDGEITRQHKVDKIPAVLLQSDGTALRFFGTPAGYEFSTLIQDIFDLSTGNIELAEETQEYLRNLDHDIHIQVFVTPT